MKRGHQGSSFSLEKNPARTHLQGMLLLRFIGTPDNKIIGTALFVVWLMALLSWMEEHRKPVRMNSPTSISHKGKLRLKEAK